MQTRVDQSRIGFDPGHMLRELSAAHQAVLDCMAAMDRITCQKLDRLEYTRARFQISAASMKRRHAFRAACAALGGRVEGEEADALRRVQAADEDLASRSAAHICRWVPSSIEGDWAAYCTASRNIRNLMKRELDVEKRLLFPILERLASGRAGSARAA